MLKAVLFDLDGTLLPMDQDLFTEGYFKLLAKKAAPRGYEPGALVQAIWRGTGAMVNNDGSHSAIATTGRIPLRKGLHAYKLVYLEDYEDQALAWAWKAENADRFSPIPNANLFYK